MDNCPDLESRKKNFEQWVREVRDPAEENSEGVRHIKVSGADAEYEIAPLPDGRFALYSSMAYRCGSCRGNGSPWRAFETREECVRVFADRAQSFFGGCVTDGQKKSQREMLDLLDGGLFGFVEPEVSAEATKKREEIKALGKAAYAAWKKARGL